MNTTVNIAYCTDRIARYFAANRGAWAQFYPSERWILERMAARPAGISRVLDVGCAAGGLGLALQDRYPLREYVGVEINEQAVTVARARAGLFRIPAVFYCADILQLPDIADGPFDLVTNLSCSDWNIETQAITDASWRYVAPGGSLVISLRLTNGPSLNDFTRSYQYITYDGNMGEGDERANYVVFNVRDALRLFDGFRPKATDVLGYGYWGRPSTTAVTPYERLVFAVFAICKGALVDGGTSSELHLPLSLWTGA